MPAYYISNVYLEETEVLKKMSVVIECHYYSREYGTYRTLIIVQPEAFINLDLHDNPFFFKVADFSLIHGTIV